MLSRLLFVPGDMLRRCWPFFALYFSLFAALTLFDGLSLTLFVQRVGPEALPTYQALSAFCVIAAVGGYVAAVDRWPSGAMFVAILSPPTLLLLTVWALTQWLHLDNQFYGLLFVGRDLAFALVLLHFGTFLQDYFSRDELYRVMPLIYAGGRVGGIAAGAAMQHLSGWIQPVDLLPVTAAIMFCVVIGIGWIRCRLHPQCEGHGEEAAGETTGSSGEEAAVQSTGGFARFVLRNPLMFWVTISTIIYFVCRTFLSFRYNQCFEREFASEVEMAAFLGAYTKYALTGSLLLQLFFVNRWIALVGLKGAHLTYAGLLLAAAVLGSFEMTLASAVFVRLVEGELRFCLRNPASQMTVNLFSKPLRIRARAWSMGFLIPASTCAAALILMLCVYGGHVSVVGVLALVAAVVYVAAATRLVGCIKPQPKSHPAKPKTIPAPHATALTGSIPRSEREEVERVLA